MNIAVDPPAAEMVPRTSQTFKVHVDGTLDASVTWSLVDAQGNGVVGIPYGAIDKNGTYTAPANVPKSSQNDFFVKATSTVDSTRFATALIHLVNAPLNPARGPTSGGTRITIDGKGFSSATTVFFGADLGTDLTVLSPTSLQVTTPPSSLAKQIGATDVKIVTGENTVLYPLAFHYGATFLRLGGGQLAQTCYGSEFAAAGDLDGNGAADVVSSCYDGKVAVMMNNGAGGVKAPKFVSVSTPSVSVYYTHQILLKDLNGDGFLDILAVNPQNISILKGDGTGNFGAPTSFAFPASSYEYDSHAVVTDIDGDGKLDLAVTLPYQSKVLTAFGVGDGTFVAGPTLTTGMYPYFIAAGKMTASGKTDLIVSYEVTNYTVPNYTGGFSLFVNNGPTGRAFAAPTTFDAKQFCYGVTVGDFDKDGNLDVATYTSSGDGSDIGIRYGNGLGAFTAESFFPDGGGGINWSSLMAADFDGDQKDDLIWASGQNVRTLYSNGTGAGSRGAANFGPFTQYTTVDYPNTVALADLGQGASLIVSDYTSIEMYLNQGARNFGVPKLDLGTGPQTVNLYWHGDNEVLATLPKGNSTLNGGAVSLIKTDSLMNTTLVSSIAKFDLPAGSAAIRAIAADLDGDTIQDAIVVDDGSGAPFAVNAPLVGAVYYLPGKLDGSLGNLTTTGLTTMQFGTSVSDARVADLDGDGNADMLVATNNTTFGTCLGCAMIAPTAGALSVKWGMGNGVLGDPVTLSGGVVPYRIDLADLDDDGKPEVVTADTVGSRVAIVKFDGATPRAPLFVDVGENPSEVVIEDVNGDFIPDLIVLSQYPTQNDTLTEVDVIKGLGTVDIGGGKTEMVFDIPDRYRFAGYGAGLTMGDIDGDGLDDIAVTLTYPAGVAVLRGHDGGKFLDPLFSLVGGSPSGITAMDFDGDGKLDLVVGDLTTKALRPLGNTSL